MKLPTNLAMKQDRHKIYVVLYCAIKARAHGIRYAFIKKNTDKFCHNYLLYM